MEMALLPLPPVLLPELPGVPVAIAGDAVGVLSASAAGPGGSLGTGPDLAAVGIGAAATVLGDARVEEEPSIDARNESFCAGDAATCFIMGSSFAAESRSSSSISFIFSSLKV
jgi:hypothetical protein